MPIRRERPAEKVGIETLDWLSGKEKKDGNGVGMIMVITFTSFTEMYPYVVSLPFLRNVFWPETITFLAMLNVFTDVTQPSVSDQAIYQIDQCLQQEAGQP